MFRIREHVYASNIFLKTIFNVQILVKLGTLFSAPFMGSERLQKMSSVKKLEFISNKILKFLLKTYFFVIAK